MSLMSNTSSLEALLEKANNLQDKESGDSGSGSINTNIVYIGTTQPTPDIGNNGDIYIMRGE
jgi:hypothetical protein